MSVTDLFSNLFDALVDCLAHGFSGFTGREIVAFTLAATHITIAAVTMALLNK